MTRSTTVLAKFALVMATLLVSAPGFAQEGGAKPAPDAATPAVEAVKKETNCSDKRDDDGDGMVDCADADCKDDIACKVGSGPENSNAKCSDWFDNDGDGFIDCDDPDCEGEGITVCKGSWKGQVDSGGGGGGAVQTGGDIPEMPEGADPVDLIGKGRDKDGERNDEVCSDGVDNDGDGMIDCADFGCRFDPEVTVCRGNPGMRFSVVGQVTGSGLYSGDPANFGKNGPDGKPLVPLAYDTNFAKLQLRSFGPIAGIQNSFYLLSLRAEKSPRMSFAMFQIPIGNTGHFFNVNSGGGGLSTALIISTSKLLLLDPAQYMYQSFEQGNGAAAEVFGPLTPNWKLFYRVFGAGGSGRSNGNVGGHYFTYDNTNYTYSAGGQIGVNVIGRVSRFDSPFLYTPVPLTFGITAGAKYDQRAQERYPAWNVNSVLRWNRLVAIAETYGKRELEFGSTQIAWNIQAGFLLIPKRILLAADFGQYHADPYDHLPSQLQTDIKKELKVPDEQMFRAAVHIYFWKNIGIFSIRYRDHRTQATDAIPGVPAQPALKEQEVLGSAQFRF
jgi:hypothetical protein